MQRNTIRLSRVVKTRCVRYASSIFYYNSKIKVIGKSKQSINDYIERMSSDTIDNYFDGIISFGDTRDLLKKYDIQLSVVLPCTPLQAYLLEFNLGYKRV